MVAICNYNFCHKVAPQAEEDKTKKQILVTFSDILEKTTTSFQEKEREGKKNKGRAQGRK
jgi:hypothetical protein